MKPMKRWLLAALLFPVCLVWRLPASLADQWLAWFSEGAVRLADAEGTVWAGRGDLMVVDPARRAWQPWLAVAWRVDWGALWRGRLGWDWSSGGQRLARAEVSPAGVSVEALRLGGPARFFAERIPHSLGRAGWRGDLALDAPGWQCDWSGRCTGKAELRWLGAASDLLRDRDLGDYRVVVTADEGVMRLEWRTLRGDVRVEGDGRWAIDARPDLRVTISGDPALLQHLPGVAGRWATPGARPGTWVVAVGR